MNHVFIKDVSVESFRNITLARLSFETHPRIFLVGKNGQGKSNLLEAIGLMGAFRSFRTHELQPLIRNGKQSARVFFRLQDDGEEQIEVELAFSRKKRQIYMDGAAVGRLADFAGRFPCVVFCADDTQLIRMGPQIRRRFFDLMFSMMEPQYLDVLQDYHRALRERNRALKGDHASQLVSAFDPVIARLGVQLVSMRMSWVEKIQPFFRDRYQQIAVVPEQGDIRYETRIQEATEEAYQKQLKQNRERDAFLGNTTVGPHRDDFHFQVKGMDSRQYASDGQIRSLVLALKLAQMDLFLSIRKVHPILLMDDILGELDADRRKQFWNALDPECQVIASGTSIPITDSKTDWRVFEVAEGAFELMDS